MIVSVQSICLTSLLHFLSPFLKSEYACQVKFLEFTLVYSYFYSTNLKIESNYFYGKVYYTLINHIKRILKWKRSNRLLYKHVNLLWVNTTCNIREDFEFVKCICCSYRDPVRGEVKGWTEVWCDLGRPSQHTSCTQETPIPNTYQVHWEYWGEDEGCWGEEAGEFSTPTLSDII